MPGSVSRPLPGCAAMTAAVWTTDTAPRSLKELISWLAERTRWFRSFFANTGPPLNSQHVGEIKRYFPDSLGGSAQVHEKAKEFVTMHLERVLFATHACLDEWEICGQPDWVNEPNDDMRWWFRANDHLSRLLNFLRQYSAQSEGTGVDSGTPKGKPRRKRGRPTDTDSKADKRLCEDWKAARRQGMTRLAFARERGISVQDLIGAQHREKYRRFRDAE